MLRRCFSARRGLRRSSRSRGGGLPRPRRGLRPRPGLRFRRGGGGGLALRLVARPLRGLRPRPGLRSRRGGGGGLTLRLVPRPRRAGLRAARLVSGGLAGARPPPSRLWLWLRSRRRSSLESLWRPLESLASGSTLSGLALRPRSPSRCRALPLSRPFCSGGGGGSGRSGGGGRACSLWPAGRGGGGGSFSSGSLSESLRASAARPLCTILHILPIGHTGDANAHTSVLLSLHCLVMSLSKMGNSLVQNNSGSHLAMR